MNSFTVQITSGSKSPLDPPTVSAWLITKASSAITVGNVEYTGSDSFTMTVSTFGQAKALEKLSGIRYKGTKLFIRLLSERSVDNLNSMVQDKPAKSSNTRIHDAFTSFIHSRYNASAKYLNLENVMQEPLIAALGINIFQHESSDRLGAAICKIIASICIGVETISLANNGLRSLSMFSSLPSQLPGLINLSFQNNNLTYFKDLDCFPGKDLVYLRELVLIGNPLVTKEMAKPGGEKKYRR